jgi:hypothetical protein
MIPLRILLVFDAMVLMFIGAGLMMVPGQLLELFHFPAMPRDVWYILAMWGCVLGTMGLGYLNCVLDPLRNISWIQIGIVRGVLEFVFSIVYVAMGIASVEQVWPGILVGAFVALSYLTLYPVDPSKAKTGPLRR